ncbi:MAG: 3-hydroxyacyl-CoA dehydrogenase NAD-binding domain-containing protein [Candidatus Latescibacterota bacterium]|jgi:3-hydroxyacyl-CoA dehydrogenase
MTGAIGWPRSVAVLGAGVMGVQIAAILAATGRRVYLLDLPEDGLPSARVERGIAAALRGRPPVFYSTAMAEAIIPGSLEDLSIVAEVDWVIEAVVEDLQIKRALLARLDDGSEKGPIISSNTSGLSIAGLVAGRSPAFAHRFLGIHFFNPPRYMKLVEIIAGVDTDSVLFERMGAYLRQELGKGVVVARDTPNFIGNRLGVMAIMALLHQVEREQLLVEEVDALSGVLMARPASATLRLCDMIGIDTLARVAETAHRELVTDPWRDRFVLPVFIERMLEAGFTGAKSGSGFYRKIDTGIFALDLQTLEYREMVKVELGALKGLRGSPQQRVQALWHDKTRWGEMGRQHLSEVLSYAAWHAGEMARDITEIDRAMRWGFNWELGPFELWDVLGVDPVLEIVEEGREEPALIREVRAADDPHFYVQDEMGQRAFSIGRSKHLRFEADPETLEYAALNPARALHGNDSAFIVDIGDDIGALVLCSKMNALGPKVLEIVQWVVEQAPFKGLVLCGAKPHFSVGADLKYIAQFIEREDWSGLAGFLVDFQQAVTAIRSAAFPVVAAVRGLSLGGGCEFVLAAAARVVAAETRMGLVETGVGLVPAGSGIAELACRTSADTLLQTFTTLFRGVFSGSAYQARAWGLLRDEDAILLAEDRIVERAKEHACTMSEKYEPTLEEPVNILGDQGIRTIDEWLHEQADRGNISEHDVLIGRSVSRVLCGRAGEARQVPRSELLALEREAFLELCKTSATRARIHHMLETGKRLKN